MSGNDGQRLDLLTIGRAGVDLYPMESGIGLQDVETFGKFLGGSPTNVAVAAARLGARAATITGVGDDPFGLFVRREMVRLGVSDAHVITSPAYATPVTFCEMFPPDDFPLYFYRFPSAPDMQLRPQDIPTAAVRSARIMWFSVTGLSEEPSRSAHQMSLSQRWRQEHTILDLDYRPALWPRRAEATIQVREFLAGVSVAVGNREECLIAVGESDPDRAADAMLEAGVDLAIVKQGADGTLAKTREERVQVPATPTHVVNGLGAGDAFGGSLCHGLLNGWSLQRTIAAASAAGAIVAARRECATAMPIAPEIDQVVTGGAHPQDVPRPT